MNLRNEKAWNGSRVSTRNHWESFWNSKDDVHEVYSNGGRVARNLRTVIELHGAKILEIGAGTGRDSFPLAQEGAEVVQLDYAESSLRILRQLAEEDRMPVSIIGGDTFALPFRDGSFDVVFHQGLLEHFPPERSEQLLKENVRVLKVGGLLLVDVPQRYHPYTVVKHLLIAVGKWFAGWERSFSVWELQRIMRRLGLTVAVSYGDWMVPSFFYRAVREALKPAGVKLPLYPGRVPFISSIRTGLRNSLLRTPLALYTGISIGVIGKK